ERPLPRAPRLRRLGRRAPARRESHVRGLGDERARDAAVHLLRAARGRLAARMARAEPPARALLPRAGRRRVHAARGESPLPLLPRLAPRRESAPPGALRLRRAVRRPRRRPLPLAPRLLRRPLAEHVLREARARVARGGNPVPPRGDDRDGALRSRS